MSGGNKISFYKLIASSVTFLVLKIQHFEFSSCHLCDIKY